VIDECHPNSHINPQNCIYMKEWLEFWVILIWLISHEQTKTDPILPTSLFF
jgi:hypothetical protein